MHVSELQTQHISKLLEIAEEHGIENANRLRKQDLVFAIVRHLMKQGQSFNCSGTLEILPDGFGFLRSTDTSYLASPDDIYVSPNQIRRFNLHTGDTIEGTVRVPKTTSAISHWCASTASTATTPKSANTKSCLKTSPRCFPPSR